MLLIIDLVCVLQPGSAGSDYSNHTGDGINEQDCIKKCFEMKKTNQLINGISMNNQGSCYCENNLRVIKPLAASDGYKTCFIRGIVSYFYTIIIHHFIQTKNYMRAAWPT